MTRDTSTRSRFLRSADGAVAVEFALIAPILLMLAVGVMSLGEELRQYRHAFQTAASLAMTAAPFSVSNTSVSTQITQSESDALTNGVKVLVGSQNVASLKATAQRVVVLPAGKTSIAWTWSTAGATVPAISHREIAAFAKPGESVMVVDVSLSRPYLFGLFGGRHTMTSHYVAGVPAY